MVFLKDFFEFETFFFKYLIPVFLWLRSMSTMSSSPDWLFLLFFNLKWPRNDYFIICHNFAIFLAVVIIFTVRHLFIAVVILTRKFKAVQNLLLTLVKFETELAWAAIFKTLEIKFRFSRRISFSLCQKAVFANEGLAFDAFDWVHHDSVAEHANEILNAFLWKTACVHVIGKIQNYLVFLWFWFGCHMLNLLIFYVKLWFDLLDFWLFK